MRKEDWIRTFSYFTIPFESPNGSQKEHRRIIWTHFNVFQIIILNLVLSCSWGVQWVTICSSSNSYSSVPVIISETWIMSQPMSPLHFVQPTASAPVICKTFV